MGFLFFWGMIMVVFLGAGYYIALRIYQGLSVLTSGVPFWSVLVVFGVLTLCMILGIGRSRLPLAMRRFFGGISGWYMGIFIYLLIYTALGDLLMAVPKLMKLSFTAHKYYKVIFSGSVLLLTVVTCLYGFINARQIDKVAYEVHLEGKKDVSDMRIVMISDLHLGSVGSEGRLAHIVDTINDEKPDLVCIAGDIFDSDFGSIRDPEAAIGTLQKIRATYGVYACLGNHDAGKTAADMVEFLEKANIQLLSDTYTVIDNRLILAGRLDRSPIGDYAGQEYQSLPESFAAIDPTMPVIVMDHNPADVHTYGSDVDLILCGHTHKGQIFPGSLITGSMYDVDHGYYRKDAQSPHVIVTSGIGYWGMPMRVGTNSELIRISIS